LGVPLLFTGESEIVIMIEVVDRRDAWVGLSPRSRFDPSFLSPVRSNFSGIGQETFTEADTGCTEEEIK
jgi:hypothetical protein